MTTEGIVKGITRMGIISQKSSILARASFETPVKQFVNATLKDNKDELNSVIENIILNQPVPVGTGLPGLLVKVTGPLAGRTTTSRCPALTLPPAPSPCPPPRLPCTSSSQQPGTTLRTS